MHNTRNKENRRERTPIVLVRHYGRKYLVTQLVMDNLNFPVSVHANHRKGGAEIDADG